MGSQIAIALSKASANLVLCSRNVESCEKVCQKIQKLGGKAIAMTLDVTDARSVNKLVQDTIQTFGKIDILVNCSGMTKHESATEMSEETWDNIIETNLKGVFLMSQAVGKHMIENRYGKIINISSVAGLRGYEPENHNSIAYTSSKGAVHTLTKDLAVKWGRYGVNVNAVAPGLFPTQMNRERIKPIEKQLAENIPMRRLGGDRDLMGAVLYFASDASNYCTGQILAIDGGSSAK